MDALEFLKVRSRMTNKCEMDCDKCLLGCNKNSRGVSCSGLETNYPNEAIQIVEEWGKEHPLISNVDKYKEVIRETFGGDLIDICDKQVPNFKCSNFRSCDECIEFWDSEYIEKEKE